VIVDIYTTGIEKYRAEGSDDEWYIDKLRDLAMDGASSADAFNAIEGIVELATREDESDVFYEHIQFLIRLARKSDTSEPPKSLLLNHKALQNMADQLGQPEIASVKELCRWYRLPRSAMTQAWSYIQCTIGPWVSRDSWEISGSRWCCNASASAHCPIRVNTKTTVDSTLAPVFHDPINT
jgi:hypothetical protein